MYELKPCPFCGAKAYMTQNYLGQKYVCCQDCGVVVWGKDTDDFRIDKMGEKKRRKPQQTLGTGGSRKMAKYIDVEPIIKGGWQLQRYNSGDGYVNQEHASLKDIPPADVRPVKRGKWEHVLGVCTPGGDPWLRCPFCKDKDSEHLGGIEMPKRWNWCPVCGASLED